MTDLHQLVSMFTEHLGVLLDLLLISTLSRFNEHQQRDVGLQERVRDVVHHCLSQLEYRGRNGEEIILLTILQMTSLHYIWQWLYTS